MQGLSAQTYPNWQLCLALADDEPASLQKLVARLAQADSRVKVARIRTNQGISRSSNAALGIATGDFIGLLDHDDLLAPFALYEVARVLDARPECDLIYSDEDKLSADGRERSLPVIKPDFSPEMLLGHNYLCHFTVVRRSLVEAVGGFRSHYDSAQDWDLYLRIAQRTQNIQHIPACLYHWRAAPTSCASGLAAKPDALESQRRVIEDHFARQGTLAQARIEPNGTFRVTWPLPALPRVSVIIPNRDKPELIRRSMAGLLEETDYSDLEIVIVDNGSTDPATLACYERLRARGVTIVPFPESFNYSAMCNAGARAASGELLLFLNNDTEVLHADWLMEMVRWAQRPGIGVVGAQLLFPDGSIQHAGMVLGMRTLCGHVFHRASPEHGSAWGGSQWYRNLLAVTGACQLVSRAVFDEIGGFDEGYRVGYSDVVLCLEAWRAGYRNLYTPYARLIHHECSTRERVDPVDDARRFAGYLQGIRLLSDPYYNELLAAESQAPELQIGSARTAAEVLRSELEQHFGATAEAPAGNLIRKIFHCRHDVRAAFPDGLLPAGKDVMTQWVLNHGRQEYGGLHDGELRCYWDQIESRPGQNLAETYLLRADLQQRFPLAMTVFGRDELQQAMRREAVLPEIYSPLEELRLLARQRGDVGELLQQAGSVQGRDRLSAWLRGPARQEYALSEDWLQRALQSIAAGELDRGVNLLAHLSYQASLGRGPGATSTPCAAWASIAPAATCPTISRTTSCSAPSR